MEIPVPKSTKNINSQKLQEKQLGKFFFINVDYIMLHQALLHEHRHEMMQTFFNMSQDD
jgi:hypothetical protein